MKNEQCLYTPTDWNRECDLLKEYLGYLYSLKMALEVMAIFKEQAILWEIDKPLSFDEWKDLYYPSKFKKVKFKNGIEICYMNHPFLNN